MDHFRNSFRCVVHDSLALVEHLEISSDARAFKDFVVNALVGTHPWSKPLRDALLLCCPGDWRDTSSFAFVAPSGTSKSDVLKFLDVHFSPT